MNHILDQFLQIARGEIGTREIGSSNKGRRVEEYQAATTLDGTGWPWCSAFTAWCLKQTGRTLGIKIPWTYSASCDKVWEDARTRGLVRLMTPQAGDIFLVRARLKSGKFSDSDAIHTGIVASVSRDGKTFTTVEGNSNDEGSAEGYEVASNTRPVSSRFVFVRWIDGVKNFEVKGALAETDPAKWLVVLRSAGREKMLESVALDGRPYISARDFGEFFGLHVTWRGRDLQTVLGEQEVPFQVRFWQKRAFYPARVLGEMIGATVVADAMAKKVVVSK